MSSALRKLPEHRKNLSRDEIMVDNDIVLDWDALQKTLNGFWKSIYDDIVE
jgi:hypothetical protein